MPAEPGHSCVFAAAAATQANVERNSLVATSFRGGIKARVREGARGRGFLPVSSLRLHFCKL